MKSPVPRLGTGRLFHRHHKPSGDREGEGEMVAQGRTSSAVASSSCDQREHQRVVVYRYKYCEPHEYQRASAIPRAFALEVVLHATFSQGVS